MTITPISDPDDPRIAPYRDIRERDLTGRQGLFLAEGGVVLRVLASAASRCRVRSVLLAENRVEGLSDVLAGLPAETPVHVAPQPVLDAIAGFPLHRGILALGERPASPPLEEVLASAGPGDVFLAACGVGNHDNMGGLFRNAAAFGARAVLLDDRCCDPFYRKAIRVSVGAVLRQPFVEGMREDVLVERLLEAGVEVLALTPSAGERLVDVRPEGPTAVLLGSEGPGLSRRLIGRCRPVGIPMAGGFDSLNVAATGAVALHHLKMRAAGESAAR